MLIVQNQHSELVQAGYCYCCDLYLSLSFIITASTQG